MTRLTSRHLSRTYIMPILRWSFVRAGNQQDNLWLWSLKTLYIRSYSIYDMKFLALGVGLSPKGKGDDDDFDEEPKMFPKPKEELWIQLR